MWSRGCAVLPPQELATSVIVVGEILQGILVIEARNAPRAARLRAWLDEIEATHLVLPVDERVIREWARLRVATPGEQNFEDMLIAATALAHRMTVVTRNIGHFAAFGIETLDPWQGT